MYVCRIFPLIVLISLYCLGCGSDDETGTDGDSAIDGDESADGDSDIDGDSDSEKIAEQDGNPAEFTFTPTPSTLSVYFQSSQDEYTTYDEDYFNWDFGDGENGKGHSLNYEYAVPGEYEVTLTVNEEDDHQYSETKTVEVTGYGAMKWKLDFDDTEWGVETGNGAMAVADDGTIYALVTPVGGARRIYSVNPDGTRNWKFDDFDYPERGSCLDPIVSNRNDTIYIVCSVHPDAHPFSTFITAISKSGTKKWTTELPDEQTVSRFGAALRSVNDNLVDELYLATNLGPGEDIPARIQIIQQNGGISANLYEYPESIVGLAIGVSDNVHAVTSSGKLIVLTSSLSELWSYEQQMEATVPGHMAFDDDGRVFLPLRDPPQLQALHADLNDSSKLLWSYPLSGDPGSPSINKEGLVCFIERSFGVKALDRTDGSLIWESSMYGYGGVPGIAAMEDGSLLAEMDSAQVGYDANGDELEWRLPAQLDGIAAIADDGTIYSFGRRDDNTVYSDALFAFYGPSALLSAWTRHRGDNANTAWLTSAKGETR